LRPADLVERFALAGRFFRLAGRDFFRAFGRDRRLAGALAALDSSLTFAATVPRAEPMVVATFVSISSAPDGFCSRQSFESPLNLFGRRPISWAALGIVRNFLA